VAGHPAGSHDGLRIAASIGAALAKPDRIVVCFSGDGSLLMNLQELATAAEERVNVKIILLNNNQLGLVRQQQQLFYGARTTALSSRLKPISPRSHAASALNRSTWVVFDPEKTLERALGEAGPCLINVPIPMDENVYPMVPPVAQIAQ